MERKNIRLEIYFMLSGFLIFLWKGFKLMENGLCFVPLKLLVKILAFTLLAMVCTGMWQPVLLSFKVDIYICSCELRDTCNRKSNQQNLGTIKSSNLCAEVIEFSSPTETAVCNLASIALPRFVREKEVPTESHSSRLGSRGWKKRYFDFEKLAEVTASVTSNLNRIIDINYYPNECARRSNSLHRPIGIGVQGLADAFILLGMPFDSPELNKDIFETIYYHALKASSYLAAKNGPYKTYGGSPVSKGMLQVDMWGIVPSDRWDWKVVREMISKNGVRNSILLALMPTASTSQILGNNECFEPYTSNVYSR
ncbi:hypothetical protein PTKIN_Ptkin09bG0160700 [Pterospermum kingtungense]